MATAQITFLTAGGPSGGVNVFNCNPLKTPEDVSSGAASSAAPRDCYVKMVLEADMRVAFGPSASATSGDEVFTAGTWDRFIPAGHKVAVLDK